MKIEMGESLFYSWLRHVKECQIVQTNWTTSSQWYLNHEVELGKIMDIYEKYFPGQLLKTYESGAIAGDAEKIIHNIKMGDRP